MLFTRNDDRGMEGVYSLMDLSVKAEKVCGKVNILSSKSELHRLLILSAFAKSKSVIKYNGKPSVDVNTTVDCLRAIGCTILDKEGCFFVEPIKNITLDEREIFCNESGSTLRFILPILCFLGIKSKVTVCGRLKDRPLSPMYELLEGNGAILSSNGKYPLTVNGRVKAEYLEIDGKVSSQFITGIILSYACSYRGGKVKVKGDFQSKPYLDITLDALKKFGIEVSCIDNLYTVKGGSYQGQTLTAGGDWSNAAFFASMGALGNKTTVMGLEANSPQGDRAIVEILKRFKATVKLKKKSLTVKGGSLVATDIDAKDIPDLIPTLSVVAAFAKGRTTVYNGERLRLKESDRIKTVVALINSIGGTATETSDGLIIMGNECLEGGVVDGCNDHRIVMAAAVASLKCKKGVIIKNAQAVNKSYPTFFEEIKKLGFIVKEV